MGRLGTVLSALFIIFAASASAAEFPARKAGLWQITIEGGHSINLRQCSDAASDQIMEARGVGFAGDCAKRDVKNSGGTITIDSVCTSAGKTTISHMVITGSLDSKYSMSVTSQAPGKSFGPPMILNAKWLGPCGADQKPGDMIMPNGTRINLLRLPKATDRPGN